MGRQFSRQLPNPLDGIQVGAVGWQEVQAHPTPTRVQKRFQRSSVVIACIVEDQNHAPVSCPMGEKLPKKLAEGEGVKSGLLLGHQLSVPKIHGSEQRHGLASGSVEQHGVRVLGRNPHHGPRAMLLEMAFVQAPQINAGVVGEAAEFFYIAAGPPGPLGQ